MVGTGPGRLVNQTQGVDALEVTSVLNPGANAVGIQGFHTSRFHGFGPRLLFLLRLHFTDGTTQDIASGAQCQCAQLLINRGARVDAEDSSSTGVCECT